MAIDIIQNDYYSLFTDYCHDKISREELLVSLSNELSELNIYELFAFYKLLSDLKYGKKVL